MELRTAKESGFPARSHEENSGKGILYNYWCLFPTFIPYKEIVGEEAGVADTEAPLAFASNRDTYMN